MASPRPTSPTGDALPPTSPQLTPRSKLKAELAALDASSDDEDTGPIDRKLLFKPAAKIAIRSDEHRGSEAEDDDEEEEEDEDESIRRPRGRLAARMHGSEQRSPAQGRFSTQNPTDTTEESTDSRVEDADAAGDDNDDEDEVRTAPRRRRVRPARSKTPEALTSKDDGSESEGLFVSPNASQHSAAGSDSDELPADIAQSSRFQALVARKREERLAREAEEKQRRDERAKRMAEEFAEGDDDGDVSDITDDDGGRQLTQKASRPSARKASKKALEEMNRETQRLSRSMQLAHEAKTKKKISKSALFERFNFKPAGAETSAEAPTTSSSRPATPVSAAHTDAEMAEASTPPSSPPSILKKAAEQPTTTGTEAPEPRDDAAKNHEGEVPQAKVDKGKAKATPADLESPKKKTPTKPRRQFRVKFPAIAANLATIDDGDDELQIAKPKKQTKIDAIFNRVPQTKAKEAQPVTALPHMAHLVSPQNPRKQSQKPSMTAGELQLSLQQRARAQAKLERERRLEMLRAKGIHVQTEEERQKERDEVEDIVARARKEAEEIMAREREDAKKEKMERRRNGEDDDGLDWDDSDDDSFAGSEGELQPIEEGEIEFSGSDEEEDTDVLDEDESAPNPMFDEGAQEADASDEENTPRAIPATVDVDEDEDEDMDVIQPSKAMSRRGRSHAQVLSDDEEDRAEVEATPKPKTTTTFPKSPSAAKSDSPSIPTSVLRSATKTFIPGLSVPKAAPAGLGLTQIFAGTMDDSQAASTAPGSGSPVEFMPSFDDFPDSQFSATAGDTQPQNTVLDSQAETQKESQGVQLDFEQSQMHGFDSLMQQVGGSQMSDMLNPTQDAGFADFSPLKQRFVDPPQSTVDTVLLHQGSPAGGHPDDEDDQMAESPLVRRQGKLRRRGEAATAAAADASSLPATAIPGSPLANMKLPPAATSSRQQAEGLAASGDGEEEDDGVSAFRLMAKAARRRRRMEKFDKKKSKARDMVHGEAEESEDEYAGLGGADGEDSSDEEDLEELRQQMIDDAKGNDGDEAKLAAFFADRERAADTAQVDKLFHDITTGMLRKRRRGGGGGGGGEFDLSDSDDGGEARRRMKRRQFAKMQKALFADERIGKIAENPRNAAFMKIIEDRDSDSDNDMLDLEEHLAARAEDSQSQQDNTGEQQQTEDHIPDSQPPANNLGRKRTRADPSEPAARPAPALRKKTHRERADQARPSSLADVRRSLSTLLGESRFLGSSDELVIPATDPAAAAADYGSDGDENDEAGTSSSSSNKENRRPAAAAVVDRISLKRSGSSNLSSASGGGGGGGSGSSRLAFAAAGGGGGGGGGMFKVPALLRRATTNSLMSQSSTTSSTTSTTGTSTANHGAAGKKHGAAGFGDDAKLRKNAGKRSGVNYFARETERREKVQLAERRREEKKWKGAEGRSKVVGGLFGGGSFE